MVFSVYIHQWVVDVLLCFGELSDVINRILEEGENGSFDIMNKPNIGDRDGAKRYEINITNEMYLELLNTFPINSSKISLRRLIYWFVENEMYVELGWSPIRNYHSSTNDKIIKKLNNICTELQKVEYQISDDYKITITEMLIKLNNLKETLKNGR